MDAKGKNLNGVGPNTMDPLSITASVITISSVVLAIVGALHAITEANQADDLDTRVSQQLQVIRDSVRQLEAQQPSDQPRSDGVTLVDQGFSKEQVQVITGRCRDLLSKLQRKHGQPSQRPKGGALRKLRWASQQRELSGKLRAEIQDTIQYLGLYLLPTQLQSYTSISNMETIQSIILQQNELILEKICPKEPKSGPSGPPAPRSSPKVSRSQAGQSSPAASPFGSWLSESRFKLEYKYIKGHGKGRYVILVRIKAYGSQILVARLSGPMFFNLPLPLPRPTRLSIRNLVSEDAPIFVACRNGCSRVVMDLLQRHEASLQDVTPNNDTPLAVAVKSGSMEIVELLLSQGANVNLGCGRFDTSPLQLAIIFRHADIVRTLLRYNADLEYTSANSWTILHNLFDRDSGRAITNQEFLGIFETKSLIFDGVQDKDGWSALHRCAAFGRPEDVQWLLNRGARSYIDSRTSRGLTPIHVAAVANNVETLEALMSQSLPPNHIENPTRVMPYHILNLTDSNGWTPLHVAAHAGAGRVMRWLLRQGADPHLRTYTTAAWFPVGSEGQDFSVTDSVRFGGGKSRQLLIDALQEVGHEVSADDEDVFWESEETSETSSDDCERSCLLSEKLEKT